MAQRFRCYACEQVEEKCACQKYCILCLGEHEVRLVEDGCYYCIECREACDYVPEAKGIARES